MPMDTDLEPFYRPHYTDLLFKIQGIQDRAKSVVLQTLADGSWHSQMDLMRVARRARFIGDVGFGMLMRQLQESLAGDFIETRVCDGTEQYFKIRDNYVGLTRAAYYRYDISV